MTLPAPSLPEADSPAPPAKRGLPFPVSVLAVIGVGALVVIVCVLGAVFSGGLGLFGGTTTGSATPTLTYEAQLRPPAERFGDGQWVVGVDVQLGAYETTVPAGSAGCAWERANSANGTLNAVVATGTAAAGEKVMVTLATLQEIVRSDNCGTWRRTSG